MKSTQENLLRLMETNFKVTSVVIFSISTYLILPKINDARGIFNTFMANGWTTISSQSLTTPKVNPEGLKDIYIPPNYGGPDSQHGSGTR